MAAKIGQNVRVGKNAIIDCTGSIADDVTIGHNVILEGRVKIGSNTRIDHNTIVRGTVHIGQNNWIYPNCMIGTGPQHIDYLEKELDPARFDKITIGDGNIIREFTTVHLPIRKQTSIGSDNYLMANTHIAHDCLVHNHTVLSNKATLGGHSEVHDFARLGFDANVHQFCKIGKYSMIAMGAAIVRDVLPFSLINKNRFTKINTPGMSSIKPAEVKAIRAAYADFPPKQSKTWYEREILQFMKRSTRGLYLPELSPTP